MGAGFFLKRAHDLNWSNWLTLTLDSLSLANTIQGFRAMAIYLRQETVLKNRTEMLNDGEHSDHAIQSPRRKSRG